MGRRRLYYGWVIVAVATLAVFMSSPGQTYVAAVFVDPIQQETGWSRTLISGLYTAGSLTAAAGMFLIGRLMDRCGPRLTLAAVGGLFGLTALARDEARREPGPGRESAGSEVPSPCEADAAALRGPVPPCGRRSVRPLVSGSFLHFASPATHVRAGCVASVHACTVRLYIATPGCTIGVFRGVREAEASR